MSFKNIDASNINNLIWGIGAGYNWSRGTHYSIGQTPEYLGEWASNAAEFIHSKYEGVEEMVAFCYRGFSGTSMATALAMMYYAKYRVSLNLMYVRKGNEKSHGKPIERSFDTEKTSIEMCVFVDDFIDEGGTFYQTRTLVEEEIGQKRWICICQRLFRVKEPMLWPKDLDYKEVVYFPPG